MIRHIPLKIGLTNVNLVIDELSQVPRAQTLDFISFHHLKQIHIIREELKSANTSYMLLSGCDKDNYKELKE